MQDHLKTIEWPHPCNKIVSHFFFEEKTFLAVIDALTKYIECEIVQSTSAAETVDPLCVIFSRNGLPDTILSDNITNFTAYEFKEFIVNNGICHLTSPLYSPSSNGQGE